jgi:cytidylate kinase
VFDAEHSAKEEAMPDMQPPTRNGGRGIPPTADEGPAVEEAVQPPRHGFQGDRGAGPRQERLPAHLTIAISRESGARGGTIGRRVARRLGWPVYDQELLEYMSQEAVPRQNVLDALPPAVTAWADAEVERLLQTEGLSRQPSFVNLARVVLSLGAQGQVVLIGRGAGCILPRESTLSARIVAPQRERVAYMSQWLRLSVEEASERVRLRDERRGDFIRKHFNRQPEDVHQYDLVLNSSLLGEGLCVELLVQAAQAVEAAGLPKGRPPAG